MDTASPRTILVRSRTSIRLIVGCLGPWTSIGHRPRLVRAREIGSPPPALRPLPTSRLTDSAPGATVGHPSRAKRLGVRIIDYPLFFLALAGMACAARVAGGSTSAAAPPRRGDRGCLAAALVCLSAFGLRSASLADGGVTRYAGTQQVLVALLLAAVLVLALALLVRRGGAPRRPLDRPLLAIMFLAWLLRLAYPHHILHVEMMGARLLGDYFAFPTPGTFRAAYGQVSFFVFGIAAQAWRSVSTVPLANGVFSALTVLTAGHVILRWTGSRGAARGVALILAVHPAFLLVGTSEDAHVLAIFLFSCALLAFDRASEGLRGGATLVLASLLLLLTAWTRQSMIPVLFVPYLALAERRGARALLRPPVLGSMALVGLPVIGHVLFNAFMHHNQFVWGVLAVLPSVPWRLLTEPHPLLDWALAPFPLPFVMLLGVVSLRRRAGVRFAPLAGLLVIGVLSAPMSVFGPGVQVAFRLPMLFFAVLLAGFGLAEGGRLLADRPRALRRLVAAAVWLPLFVCAMGGASRLAAPTPETQELEFLQRALPKLPPGTVIVTPGHGDLFAQDGARDPSPNWSFPLFLLDPDAGLQVVELGSDWRGALAEGRNVVVYRSLACSTLSLSEGSPAFGEMLRQSVLEGVGTVSALHDAVIASGDPLRQPDPALLSHARRACYEGVAAGAPLGDGMVTTVSKPWAGYAPSQFYPLDRMEIGFYSLGPSALDAPHSQDKAGHGMPSEEHRQDRR